MARKNAKTKTMPVSTHRHKPQLVLHTLIELACLLASIAYTFKTYAKLLVFFFCF